MTSASYRPDHKGMRQLGMSSDMGKAMQRAARTGQRWAESAAPRGATGVYAASFRVVPATLRGGRDAEDRAGAVLENTAEHAVAVELRHAVLARAVNIIEGQR